MASEFVGDDTPILNSLAPKPKDEPCQYCGGAGWVYIERDNGQLLPSLERCPICGPRLQQIYLQRISRIPPNSPQASYTLENARVFQHNQKALNTLRDRVAEPRGFVLLYGPNGVGKSHLLMAAVNTAVDIGRPAVYIPTATLLDELRKTFDPKAEQQARQHYAALSDGPNEVFSVRATETFSELFTRLCRVRVLALDELDRFHSTEWAMEKLFQLFDERYRRAHELLTIMATNLTPEQLPSYFYSRCSRRGNAVIAMDGPDLRRLLSDETGATATMF